MHRFEAQVTSDTKSVKHVWQKEARLVSACKPVAVSYIWWLMGGQLKLVQICCSGLAAH